jgi:hypothetical protein
MKEKGLFSRIFRKREPVQPEVSSVIPAEQPAAQPVAQAEILVPEWKRREQERINRGTIEQRILERRGIDVPTGKVAGTLSTARTPKKGWGDGHGETHNKSGSD